jgi:hypothetical protein
MKFIVQGQPFLGVFEKNITEARSCRSLLEKDFKNFEKEK